MVGISSIIAITARGRALILGLFTVPPGLILQHGLECKFLFRERWELESRRKALLRCGSKPLWFRWHRSHFGSRVTASIQSASSLSAALDLRFLWK